MARGYLHNRTSGLKPAIAPFPTACAESPTDGANPLDANPLEKYFDSHTQGRGIWKWRHYFDIYDSHFRRFVGKPVNILEIGVYSGGSLDMWRQYFGSKCRIYGVDIEEACKAYENDAVRIFVGDQADRTFWERFKREVPTLDIVIDDGGHLPHQQIATLEALLPHLRPGAVYLCEDVHGTYNAFADYISGLSYNLNAVEHESWHSDGVSSSATAFQSAIASIHLYPFVVVIEKTQKPVEEFSAPKHGTQWQPFL